MEASLAYQAGKPFLNDTEFDTLKGALKVSTCWSLIPMSTLKQVECMNKDRLIEYPFLVNKYCDDEINMKVV